MAKLSMIAKQNNLLLVKCRSIFTKARGFMFSEQDKILIFYFDKERFQSIHMLFVFFPIDLYFLNKKKEVVEIKKNLRPFSFYASKKKAQYFVEIPSFISREIKINLNEKIVV